MRCQQMGIFFFSLLLFFASCSQESSSDLRGVEANVRKSAVDLAKAINGRDAEQAASFWAEEGVFFHPLTGETSTGRDEIAHYYKNFFANHPDGEVEIDVDAVEVNSPTQVTERGVFRVKIQNQPAKEIAFEAVLGKEEEKWLLQEVREIDLEPSPSHLEHLKDLGWLIGDFVDRDENIEIAFTTKWDRYKNFLIQHFTSQVFGQLELEGEQVIGWDPIDEKVRSWVFDSDGGFGQGDWSYKDNSWHVDMAYTLADGRLASATLIYMKIDDNSYTFSSVSRDVDGEVLPDIDPVKVVRK